jgi:hypothetical protein
MLLEAPADAVAGGPAEPRPLPEELTGRLLRAIEARAGRCVADFAVRSWAGRGLVVSGQAHSFYAKQVAQHVAARLTGLPVLSNRIVVSKGRKGMP